MSRAALITGATRGIGREVARQLRELDFVLFVAGRDARLVEALKGELGCEGLAIDLANPESAERLYESARKALGRIDLLVNNAGFNKAKEPIERVTGEDLDHSYAVNVRAPILLAREALKEMASRGSGHIVNVLSSIVRVRMEAYSIYTTMKQALDGFTGCLLKEARRSGVKVTAVYPGGVNTRFRSQARPDYMDPASVARMIVHCVTAPDDVVVHELLFRPMVEDNF